MTSTRRRALLALGIVAFALTATARVISYAPYTDRTAFPAVQARTNRYFALVEAAPAALGVPSPSPTYGQLVIYDSTGAEPPRVAFPQDGTNAAFTLAAAREAADGTLTLLVQSTPSYSSNYVLTTSLSTDGGRTWKATDMPNVGVYQLLTATIDTGGRYVGTRYSPVRIGNAQWPFVLVAYPRLYAISANGTAKVLFDATTGTGPSTTPPPPVYNQLSLAGSDYAAVRFIVHTESGYLTVDLDGKVQRLAASSTPVAYAMGEGFIATDGSVYVEETGSTLSTLWRLRADSREAILTSPSLSSGTPGVFAIPTSDYNAAWVIQRGSGKPTVLYRHIPGGTLEKQWEDITSPEVEALHAGNSGKTVLIQVHRPRPAVDQQMFKDPALAVWHVGDPAPRTYDELFMNEQTTKGFVHVDADKIESGEPFVFNSGTPAGSGGIIWSPAPPPPSSAGSDVVQEWGVVRASLKQRLVLPSIGRVQGSYGSDWVTDVIVQNPLDVEQRVKVNYFGNGEDGSLLVLTSLILAPHETHLYRDALKSIFNFDSGTGAMTFEPESGVTVTSRTYTKSAAGTFGFGMNAVDELAAAASPRFPVTFAGAFAGSNYRTNMTITYPSGRGSGVQLTAASHDGLAGTTEVAVPPNAHQHQQINEVTGLVGLRPSDTGALIVTPKSNSAIVGLYAIDNRTNDSTYFPPDLPTSNLVRTIPAIGHLDGANGSTFRTDLYLYNPSDAPRVITLQAKRWDIPESPATLQLTLLGHEARVIRDALYTVFGKTGIARLRFSGSTGDSSGVRLTSRTYSVDANGGTYGFLMPPLNNFQIGGSGDTLEILGAVGDPNFRVNIGLVDMTGFATSLKATARVDIVDSSGKTADSFTATFDIAGGTQLNDVLRARALNVTGPILIRVTPTNGTIGAYATMTDNGTNDSVYLAANLAAK